MSKAQHNDALKLILSNHKSDELNVDSLSLSLGISSSLEDARTVIRKNNPSMDYNEFSKLSFTDGAPNLFFFIMYLICGDRKSVV